MPASVAEECPRERTEGSFPRGNTGVTKSQEDVGDLGTGQLCLVTGYGVPLSIVYDSNILDALSTL